MRPMTKKSPSGARAAVASGLRVGRSDTLAALVVEKGCSPLRALSAFNWIGAWGIVHDSLEREPRSVEEVAQVVKVSPRTVYGWQAAFREIFPEYSTPAVLWAKIHEQVETDDPVVAGLSLGGASL